MQFEHCDGTDIGRIKSYGYTFSKIFVSQPQLHSLSCCSCSCSCSCSLLAFVPLLLLLRCAASSSHEPLTKSTVARYAMESLVVKSCPLTEGIVVHYFPLCSPPSFTRLVYVTPAGSHQVDISGSRDLKVLLPLIEGYSAAFSPDVIIVKSFKLKRLLQQVLPRTHTSSSISRRRSSSSISSRRSSSISSRRRRK